MKITEIITESRGLYARSIADPPFTAVANNSFGAQVGDEYQFMSITNYPTVGAFKTSKDLLDAIKDVEDQLGDIIWVVRPAKSHLAFAIASFQGPAKKTAHYGKLFDKILPSMMSKWANDDVPGLQPELVGSKKARAFKPQDVLGSVSTFANGQELNTYLQSRPDLPAEVKQGLDQLYKKQLPRFSEQAKNFTSIRDNLGEIMQALACTSGLIGGQADAARKQLLKNAPWKQLTVYFPPDKTSGLIDFYLRSGNFSMGVSSKGAGGAAASVRNLYDGLRLAQAAGQDLTAEYPLAAAAVTAIATKSMIEGPLYLAEKMTLITPAQSLQVGEMISQQVSGTTIPAKYSWIKPWIKNFSSKLPLGWNYGYWTMAAIAAKVASTINDDPTFSEGCVAFLNYSSMIQLYTDAKVEQEDVVITGFTPIYPPRFQGRVVLVAGKSYYATDIKQRFTFDFKGS